ncbi:MAG: 7-carboxy-7-deazaguanine synthase QueE [Pseudomonadota bacterium]
MEHFYTLQGEGYYHGYAAYFIRLAGCDVGCVWCDVKESWDEKEHSLVSFDTLVKKASSYPAEICVITGGEPLMHNLDLLTNQLIEAGKRTHLETSGAYPLSGQWNWICISPKKFKAPLDEVLFAAHELKVVIFHKSDLEWAQSFQHKVNKACKLFLQPEWSKEKTITPLIIDFIKQHPEWSISLQTHKYMNIP